MTKEDFLRAVAANDPEMMLEKPNSTTALSYEALFNLADSDGDGLIGFEEYLLFEILMTGPEADYHIAFSLFDKDGDGLVTYEEFTRILLQGQLVNPKYGFDMDSDWALSFFGRDKDHKIDFNEFTQLLKGLEGEKLRQAFRSTARDGYISGKEFEEIFLENCSARKMKEIPPKIRENLSTILGDRVNFADYIAFYNVLHNLDRVRQAIISASEAKRHRLVGEKELLRTARRLRLYEFTPTEAALVFRLLDEDRDGNLSIEDMDRLLMNPAEVEPIERPTSAMQYALDAIIHFGLGAVAGAIGAFTVYPIDLIKTRMQNQRSDRIYLNSWDCFIKTVRAEGVRGLYRGVGPQLIGVAPEKAIKLTVNDLLRSMFGQPGGHIYLPLEILAGAAAGTSQVIFTNPIEIVKIRLQMQGEEFRRHGIAPKSTWSIIRELGMPGLYKGAGACLLRDAPFSAIYFPVYAKTKEYLTDPDAGRPTAWQLLLAGAVAGVPAASLVTPADVVKTRLQVVARSGQTTYKNIPDAFRTIYREEGFRAFFKGAGMRVFRSSPQFGVTLLAYELFQRSLVPDLKNPAPPTNAPVHEIDYNLLFRGGVGRSVSRAEQRWGLFGHHHHGTSLSSD